MYGYIKGGVDSGQSDYIIIETGGVGYLVYCDLFTLSEVKQGEKAKIYTYLQVKEDALTLFGFMDTERKTMFETLIAVNGVGAKVAMKILSKLKPRDVIVAIVSDDTKAFKGISGLGPKISGRIILELKGKFAKDTNIEDAVTSASIAPTVTKGGKTKEAVDALLGLGYNFSEATNAIKAVYKEDMSVEDLIFHALKGR